MVLCLPDGATWAHWIFAITFVAKCMFSFGLLLVLIFGPCGIIDYIKSKISCISYTQCDIIRST